MLTSNNISSITRRNDWYIIDILIIVASIFLSIFINPLIRYDSIEIQFTSIVILFISLFCYISVGALYAKKFRRGRSWKRDIRSISIGTIFTLLLLLMAFIFTKIIFTETTVLTFIIPSLISFFLLIFFRSIEYFILQKRQKGTIVLFVDISPQWSHSLIEIRQSLDIDWQLAFTHLDPNRNKIDLPLGTEEWDESTLIDFINTKENKYKKYLVVFDHSQPKSDISNSLIQSVYGRSFVITSMHDFYEEILEKAPLIEDKNIWYSACITQKPNMIDLFLKRALDITTSSILLILFAPVILILGLKIKKESKGPAFYNQARLGFKGKPFICYKLRTMEEHEDDVNQWPKFSSHHVTKLGKKLRNTGLDELPQLFNVLKGDMSMVGPRPLRQKLAERHIEKNPFFAVTLSYKPGISGWAQVHQGKDTGDDTLLQKIRYDLYYAKHFSVILDLYIYILTFSQLVTGKKPDITTSDTKSSIERN